MRRALVRSLAVLVILSGCATRGTVRVDSVAASSNAEEQILLSYSQNAAERLFHEILSKKDTKVNFGSTWLVENGKTRCEVSDLGAAGTSVRDSARSIACETRISAPALRTARAIAASSQIQSGSSSDVVVGGAKAMIEITGQAAQSLFAFTQSHSVSSSALSCSSPVRCRVVQ